MARMKPSCSRTMSEADGGGSAVAEPLEPVGETVEVGMAFPSRRRRARFLFQNRRARCRQGRDVRLFPAFLEGFSRASLAKVTVAALAHVGASWGEWADGTPGCSSFYDDQLEVRAPDAPAKVRARNAC
jgi:hypothetical protein